MTEAQLDEIRADVEGVRSLSTMPPSKAMALLLKELARARTEAFELNRKLDLRAHLVDQLRRERDEALAQVDQLRQEPCGYSR